MYWKLIWVDNYYLFAKKGRLIIEGDLFFDLNSSAAAASGLNIIDAREIVFSN